MTLQEIATTIRDTPLKATLEELRMLIALQVDLARMRVDLWQELAERRAQYLYPQEKGKTELDRKTMLESSVASIEHDYEFALKLEDILANRIDCTVIKE